MKKISLRFILLILSLFILTACSAKTTEPEAVPQTSQPSGLIAEGRLMPVNTMDQSFAVSGQVAEVLVQDGEAVKEGQVLARLHSSPDLQLALLRAQQEALAAQQALDEMKNNAQVTLTQGRLDVITAQEKLDSAQESYDSDATDENKAVVEAAQATLDRIEAVQEELEAGDGVDPDHLAAAEARLASARAAVESAEAAVYASELKATMDGTVVDLNLKVGQRITAGQPVLTLADFSGWVVKTDNLTEEEVVNVEPGKKVEIVLDALPEVILAGEVVNINTRFEEKRGDITYTVTVALQQTDPAMRWGMTAAVQIEP